MEGKFSVEDDGRREEVEGDSEDDE